MNQKRPSLGKGLSALFPSVIDSTGNGATLFECPVDRIDALEGQPRTRFDEAALSELADSIRQAGIIQPLVVSESDGGRYRLIAGERRLRAARLAGLPTVPVVVRQAAPENAFIMALVENIQREDLNPVEQARAYHHLVKGFGLTQEEISRRVGRQRSTVANSLRLLKLHEDVLAAVENGSVPEGSARALIGQDIDRQLQILKAIVLRNLSTREVEDLVKKDGPVKKTSTGSRAPAMSAYFSGAREELETALELPVKISFKGNSGKLLISFNSLAQFKALRKRLAE
jgi:ParB family chromosome partitioning protein